MSKNIKEKQKSWFEKNRELSVVVGILLVFLLVGTAFSFHFIVRRHYEPKIITPVISAKPVDTISIIVGPIEGRPTDDNLVSSKITITDPVAIENICNALNKAKPSSLNHQRTYWETVLVLNLKTGSFKFVVFSTGSSDEGVFILFHSNGEDGWNLGCYRADDLGPTLEEIIHDHIEPRL